jgi:hypothetical protein
MRSLVGPFQQFNEGGGEVVYEVRLLRPGRLTASVDEVEGDGVDVDVHLLRGPNPTTDCVQRDHIGVDVTLEPGTYLIAVDTWVSSTGRVAAGPYALSVDFVPSAGGIWQPTPGTSWQWQLSGTVDTSVEADVYDVDLFDVPQSTLDGLKAQGRKLVCYFSAGTVEDWRADAGAFPLEAKGAPMEEWAGERWLDVRHAGVRSVLAARLDHAVARGCDAVEPDNVDGYDNSTGFPLTRADQVAFNLWLADEAHDRGLSVGLKNATGLVPDLVDHFDFAVNEECVAYEECATTQPFVHQNKAVFHVEYVNSPSQGAARLAAVCDAPGTAAFSTLVKTWDLDAWRLACPSDVPVEADLFAELTALTQSCSRVAGTSDFRKDSGGSRTVPICQLPGAIWWTADLDVDCDGGQQSSCTIDPWYQSSTAAVDSQGDYLDANELPFVVVPRSSNGFSYAAHGLAMGSVVAVLYDGRVQFGVVGDVGPAGVIGEASYAMAEALGVNPSPVSGGVASGVTYIHFTGTSARVNPIEDTVRAQDLGLQKAQALIDTP